MKGTLMLHLALWFVRNLWSSGLAAAARLLGRDLRRGAKLLRKERAGRWLPS